MTDSSIDLSGNLKTSTRSVSTAGLSLAMLRTRNPMLLMPVVNVAMVVAMSSPCDQCQRDVVPDGVVCEEGGQVLGSRRAQRGQGG
jgi:hypothetical protein